MIEKVSMKNLILTAKDFNEKNEYVGKEDLSNFNGSIASEIELMIFDSLKVYGDCTLCAGSSPCDVVVNHIEVGGDLRVSRLNAGGCIRSGGCIYSLSEIVSGGFISAVDSIFSGSYITAKRFIESKNGAINAVDGVKSGGVVEALKGIVVGSFDNRNLS